MANFQNANSPTITNKNNSAVIHLEAIYVYPEEVERNFEKFRTHISINFPDQRDFVSQHGSEISGIISTAEKMINLNANNFSERQKHAKEALLKITNKLADYLETMATAQEKANTAQKAVTARGYNTVKQLADNLAQAAAGKADEAINIIQKMAKAEKILASVGNKVAGIGALISIADMTSYAIEGDYDNLGKSSTSLLVGSLAVLGVEKVIAGAVLSGGTISLFPLILTSAAVGILAWAGAEVGSWLWDKLTDDHPSLDQAEQASCPIVIDLNGDGIHATKLAEGLDKAVYFDLDGNGFAEKTAWIDASDALLVLDKNANGCIDNGHELFGNHSLNAEGKKAFADGYAALAAYDENQDGRIDAQDAVYAQLAVWQDKNGLSKATHISA